MELRAEAPPYCTQPAARPMILEFMTAACSHADAHIGQRVCRHLWSGEAPAYAHRFTGDELDYDLVCPDCADELEEELVVVCAGCFEAIAERAAWTRGEGAVLSQPRVAERATRLAFNHQMVRLSVPLGASLLDLQPQPAGADSRWLAVTSAGTLISIDLGARTWRAVADLAGAIDLEADVSLSVSPDGQMAAVVESHGQSGVVIDVGSGEITMLLDRAQPVDGGRFPLAFASAGGRLVLVHATDWNRIDAFDPRTGSRLTARSSDEEAARSLDYVCSGLAASPDGEWLIDNGFTAQGAGMPAAFRLRPWLSENPWESVDGGSRRYLCQRWDYWDGPLCWIDGRTVALWGYGPDRDSLIPAVILFDVATGEALRWFPGPRGAMIYDDLLFALGDGDGVSVWDVDTGERLLHDAGFHPLRYHPGTRQFLTTNPDGELFVLSRLVGDIEPREA
jgi:hypothetical protein